MGVSLAIVGLVGALLGLALLMRRRLIRRRQFSEALGLTDHRPPMLDGELDDGNEGPVFNPVGLLFYVSWLCVISHASNVSTPMA